LFPVVCEREEEGGERKGWKRLDRNGEEYKRLVSFDEMRRGEGR